MNLEVGWVDGPLHFILFSEPFLVFSLVRGIYSHQLALSCGPNDNGIQQSWHCKKIEHA